MSMFSLLVVIYLKIQTPVLHIHCYLWTNIICAIFYNFKHRIYVTCKLSACLVLVLFIMESSVELGRTAMATQPRPSASGGAESTIY